MKKLTALLLALAALAAAGCQTTTYVPVGQRWQALYGAPRGDAAQVSLAPGKSAYKVGETMSFTVSSDKEGKLWLITVGPDDKPVLVFPNPYVQDNVIPGNREITIPGEMESWKIRAAEPVGRNLVVAMVTGRDATLDDIKEFLHEAGVTKEIVLERAGFKYGMDRKIVEVRR